VSKGMKEGEQEEAGQDAAGEACREARAPCRISVPTYRRRASRLIACSARGSERS
jgi:hypothetical protein